MQYLCGSPDFFMYFDPNFYPNKVLELNYL